MLDRIVDEVSCYQVAFRLRLAGRVDGDVPGDYDRVRAEEQHRLNRLNEAAVSRVDEDDCC
jgi:hypothetical protein